MHVEPRFNVVDRIVQKQNKKLNNKL